MNQIEQLKTIKYFQQHETSVYYDKKIRELNNLYYEGREVFHNEVCKVIELIRYLESANAVSMRVTINSHEYKHRRAKSGIVENLNNTGITRTFNLSIVKHMLPDFKAALYGNDKNATSAEELSRKELNEDAKLMGI